MVRYPLQEAAVRYHCLLYLRFLRDGDPCLAQLSALPNVQVLGLLNSKLSHLELNLPNLLVLLRYRFPRESHALMVALVFVVCLSEIGLAT